MAGDVVTVNPSGRITGTMRRASAHAAPGTLHLAVSVQLFDEAGRCLLQRRASGKSLFARRWANTCCGHPLPGEPAVAAAVRRLEEELGLVVGELRPAGSFLYRAIDEETGGVEHELDRVFVGRVAGHPSPVATEIEEVTFVSHEEASALLGSPAGAPWARQVVDLARAAVLAAAR